jgi:hypothetical protein
MSRNTEMFALRQPPPETIELAGRPYRLVRVFKHDFFAATCLYEIQGSPHASDSGDSTRRHRATETPSAGPRVSVSGTDDLIPRIVVKFGRTQRFCGLPTAWYATSVRAHEETIYSMLAGIPGVPRWAGRVGRHGYAIEYIEGKSLDHFPTAPPGFFDGLRRILDAVHARGICYCDAHKRSNILVGPGGRPYLIDYQIAFRRRDDLPWPLRPILRAIVAYFQRADIYHLYKHKRRLCPQELTPEEEVLSRRRGRLHTLHRKLTDPWRVLRRWFLRTQYQKGRLVSPTAQLEDTYQPETATWRKDPGTHEGHGP